MSVLWQKGGIGKINPKAALESAQKSLKQGNPFGQYALARIYRDSQRTNKSKEYVAELAGQAFAGLKRYAATGDTWAQAFIGEMLDLGIGVPRDAADALVWYRRSAEGGNSLAQINVAKFLLNADKKTSAVKPPEKKPLRVLVVGDSMSLCGFGKRLDERFRSDPEVESTFTYMACGTNPLSWLKESPFTNIKTLCGFWSIESIAGARQPREFRDTYGTKVGHFPKEHTVPKLEDLLAAVRPDILVVQLGTNLLSLFPDGKTLQPARHGQLLRNRIEPFIVKALNSPAPLRKIFWVASPTSGRVSAQIQDFILEQIQAAAGSAVKVIDSRQLVSYPYRRMEVDNEHFVGVEMDDWADKVFKIIRQDLDLSASLPILGGAPWPPIGSSETGSNADEMENDIELIGSLTFKSQPLDLSELKPYQESLVGYLYKVVEVVKGRYDNSRVLVMHPAHIRFKKQPLDKYQIGKLYTLRLRELNGTAWQTIKSKDESDSMDLEPYIQVEDAAQFPGLANPQSK